MKFIKIINSFTKTNLNISDIIEETFSVFDSSSFSNHFSNPIGELIGTKICLLISYMENIESECEYNLDKIKYSINLFKNQLTNIKKLYNSFRKDNFFDSIDEFVSDILHGSPDDDKHKYYGTFFNYILISYKTTHSFLKYIKDNEKTKYKKTSYKSGIAK